MKQANDKVAAPIRDESKMKFRNLECSIIVKCKTLKISLIQFILAFMFDEGSIRVKEVGIAIADTIA